MIDAHSSERDRNPIVAVALAEFNALRKEISDRSAAQTTIVNINLTVVAAVATVVFSSGANVLALLVLPIISPCFGMLFFDHASNIDQIGQYIQYELRKTLTDAAQSERLLDYEEWARRYERTFFPRALSLGVPLLVIFAGVPVAALVRTVPSLTAVGAQGMWGLGVGIVLVFLARWFAFIRHPFVAGQPQS